LAASVLPLTLLLLLFHAIWHIGTPAFAATASNDLRSKVLSAMSSNAVTFEPMAFNDLPGWSEDDHLAAWKA
jgi:membrane-bound lytic murein transglycosylase A